MMDDELDEQIKKAAAQLQSTAIDGWLISKPLGEFRIVGKPQFGGMGVVYPAVLDIRGHDIPVAIKFLHPKYATDEALEIFKSEATALARVQGMEGLVRILKVATCDVEPFKGQPFLVTEFIEGVSVGPSDLPQLKPPLVAEKECISLKDLLSEDFPTHNDGQSQPVAAARRLQAGFAVTKLLHCIRAIEYVHFQNIVHRDLKLENILLKPSGDAGGFAPKIIDFGLGLPISSEDGLGVASGISGTRDYMAPEQLRGDSELSNKVDIWSLGVILVRTITGHLPFESCGKRSVSWQLKNLENPPNLKGIRDLDLRKICRACLDDDPEQRPTAVILRKWLEKWLRRESLPWASYPRKVQLWVLRNLTLAVAFGLMAVALAFIVPLFLRTISQSESLLARTTSLQQRTDELTISEARAQRAIKDLEFAKAREDVLNRNQFHQVFAGAGKSVLSKSLSEVIPSSAQLLRNTEHRPSETALRVQLSSLMHLSSAPWLESMRTHRGNVTQWAWSRDGATTVLADSNSWSVWDGTTGVRRYSVDFTTDLRAIAVSPDGSRVAISDQGGQVQLRDGKTGALIARIATEGAVTHLAWRPDGQWLAALESEPVRLHVLAGDSLLPVLSEVKAEGSATALQFDPAGRFLLAAGGDSVVIYEIEVGEDVDPKVALSQVGHTTMTGSIKDAAFHPTKEKFAATNGNIIELWSNYANASGTTSDEREESHYIRDVGVEYFTFHPSGEYIFAGGNGNASVWQESAFDNLLAEQQQLEGLNEAPIAAFSPDGRFLLTVSGVGELAVWQSSDWKQVTRHWPHSGRVSMAGFRPEGHRIWSLVNDNLAQSSKAIVPRPIELIDVNDGSMNAIQNEQGYQLLGFVENELNAIESSPTDDPLISEYQIVRVHSGERITKFHAAAGMVFRLAEPDRLIASRFQVNGLDTKTMIQVLDAESGVPCGPEVTLNGWLTYAGLSAEGSVLFCLSPPGFGQTQPLLQGWSVDTGEELFVNRNIPQSSFYAAAHHQDENSLAIATNRGVQLVDLRTGMPSGQEIPLTFRVTQLSFDSSGERLLVGTGVEASVIDASNGRREIRQLKDPGDIFRAKLSPDGKTVAIGVIRENQSGQIKLYDSTTGQLKSSHSTHGTPLDIHFSSDASQVAVVNGDSPLWMGQNELYSWTMAANEFARIVLPLGRSVSVAGYGPGGQNVIVGRNDLSFFSKTHKYGEDGSMSLWNSSTGFPESLSAPIPIDPVDISFSDDGASMFAVCGDVCPRPRVVQLDGHLLTTQASHDVGQNIVSMPEIIQSSAFVALMTDSIKPEDRQLTVWDLQKNESRFSVHIDSESPLLGMPQGMACSRDGRWIAVAVDDKVRIVDSVTGKANGTDLRCPVPESGLAEWNITSLGFSSDGTLVFSVAHCNERTETAAFVWEVGGSGPPHGPFLHKDDITAVVVDSLNHRLATASEDGTAAIWDFTDTTKLPIVLEHSASVLGLEFSPDSRYLATASKDETARVWEAESGFPITPDLEHGGPVKLCHFRPDGKQLLTVSGTNVFLWPLATVPVKTQDLAALGELLAGSRFDAGSVVPFSFTDWRQEWERLRTEYPDMFHVSREKEIKWHSAAAWELCSDKKWSAARDHVDTVLTLNSNPDWHTLVQRGLINQADEKPEAAISDYDQAVKAGADGWAIHWQLGEMHLGLESPNMQRAEQEFAIARQQNPMSADLAVSIAQSWQAAGQATKALEQYEVCLRIDADSLDALLGKAELIAETAPESAIELCTKALQQREESWLALAIRGVAYRIQKQDEKALADLQNAASIPGVSAYALEQLGDLQIERNLTKEAEATWIRFTDENTNDWYGWQQRGVAEGRQEKWTDAQRSFQKAYDLFKQESATSVDQGNQGQLSYFLGLAQQSLMRHDLARPLFLEATQNGRECWEDLAESSLSLHLFADAEREYQSAVEKDPGDRLKWYWLGVSRIEQGKASEALEAFQKARTLDPNDVFSFQAQAFAEIAGNLDSAKETCKDFWGECHPDNLVLVLDALVCAPDLFPDLESALQNLDAASTASDLQQKYNLLRLKAGVLLRMQRFDDALQSASEAQSAHEHFVKSIEQHAVGSFTPKPIYDDYWGGPSLWLTMALAHAGNGDKEESQLWLDRAAAIMARPPEDVVIRSKDTTGLSPEEAGSAAQQELLRKFQLVAVMPDTWQNRLQLRLLKSEVEKLIDAGPSNKD